jgi:NitT/TauT family transport system substrate-binding protein
MTTTFTARARSRAALALTTLAALAVTGCSGSDDSGSKVSLMLDVAVLPKHAPFYAAAAEGFFEAEGIDLKIQPGSGSGNTVSAVDTGRVDFGWADFGVTVVNQGKGVHVRQINLVQGASAYSTIALPDSGIDSWEDLKGKTVATEGNGAMTYMLPAALNAAGLAKDDVEVVNVTGESKIPGLLAKKWDANLALFVSDAPVLKAEGVDPVVLKWADIGLQYYGNGIIASEETIEKRADLATRFNEALQKGFLWSCDHPEEAAAHFMDEVRGFEEATVVDAVEEQCSLAWTDENRTLGFGAMSDEGVQEVIDVAGTYLGLEDPAGLTPDEVYSNDLIATITEDDEIASPPQS